MEEQFLRKDSKGLFFVVSAPAGTGKNTLVNRLRKEFDHVVESISYTTREPRKDEVNGKDYFFISKENFFQKRDAGVFLESAEVFGNYYGTSKEWIENERNKGNHVILIIDTQGAMALRKDFDGIFIFVMPPSIETLQKRLVGRNTENTLEMEKRLKWAEEEIRLSLNYDYVFINDDLEDAYDIFRSIFVAEEHKVRK